MSEPQEEPISIPWYQSRIIQQQVVQVVVGVTTLAGLTTDIDWNATVAGIFAAIGLGVAGWTIVTRIVRASPPISGSKQDVSKVPTLTDVAPPGGA